MPVSASHHRNSSGSYHNKRHDNIRGKSTTWAQSTNPENLAILNEISRLGGGINRVVNSQQKPHETFFPRITRQNGIAAPLLLLLSQVRPNGNLLSATTDTPTFPPERSVPTPVSRSTVYSDNSDTGFSTMLNPVANALYETGQFIARHDPLKFPAADAATLPLVSTKELKAVNIDPDLKSDSYTIKDEQKKNEVIASIVQYLVSNGQLTADEGEDAEFRLRSEAADAPLIITQLYNENPRTSRVKRAQLLENDPRTEEHIKQHCAFEEEVLDTEGANQGKILLFQAQRHENPFRFIFDNNPGHGPSPVQRGVSDGVTTVFDILTVGIKPLIGNLLANAKRREYYENRGDRICAERFRRLNKAEFLTSVDGGGLTYNAAKAKPRILKPVELLHTSPSPRRAAFYTRNPHSQITTEILLELKLGKGSIDDNGRVIYLKPTKKSNEFTTYHPDAPRPDLIEKRVIVDETTMSWRYADSFDTSNLDVRVIEGKRQIELKGDYYPIEKNAAGGYEILVVKESGVKELVPVYMEPLSKKWHLGVSNEHPIFNRKQADCINQLQTEIATGFDYTPVENLNPTYYGNGKIYNQKQSGDYFGSTWGRYVEMNGKLVPVRHTQHKGAGVLYEVYDPKQPNQQGYPIEWDGERWLFERKTSIHASKDLEKLISPEMISESINTSMLSAPNYMGLRYDKEGQGYLKIDNKWLRIYPSKSNSELPNRFSIKNKDNSNTMLKFRDGQFHLENISERDSVIRGAGDDISPEFDRKIKIDCAPLHRAKRSLPPCDPSPVNRSPNSATGENISANSKTAKAGQEISTVTRLQQKKNIIEKAIERFPTCDVKTQEVLKLLRKDKELWNDLDGKLEVRVIKVLNEAQEIVLHPVGEENARWSGKYHVYLTYNSEGKRLIIDPYIGGDKSCAQITEQEFIKSHWKGKEGEDFVLETVAPTKEVTKEDGSYTPEFTIKDYMDNLFDPDTYESHKFFYR